MQLEQQESFVIQGPQLEVLGKAESRLPTPVRKRPLANIVLGVAILVSVLGIGGAQLKGRQSTVLAQYTAAVDDFNHSIPNDLAALADASASFINIAGTACGEDAVQEARTALEAWNAAGNDPTSQYIAEHRLYSAIDGVYNTYVREFDLSPDAKDRLEKLYDTVVSTQAVLDREGNTYNAAARDYNAMAGGFPANLVGALWGAGSVPEFSA